MATLPEITVYQNRENPFEVRESTVLSLGCVEFEANSSLTFHWVVQNENLL